MIKENKKTIKQDTYAVQVYCRNCGEGEIKKTKDGEFFSENIVLNIPQGTLLKDAECPKCKCKKLSLKIE
jgi:hypothetical protein